MKWKFTLRYLTCIVITMLIVLFINIAAFIRVITPKEGRGQKIFTSAENPLNITRNFKTHIQFKNGEPYVTQSGIKLITKKELWFQLLDENGNEVLSINKPAKIEKHYTPADIAYLNISHKDGYTSFIDIKDYNGKKWSYIIGFPADKVSKYTIFYSPPKIIKTVREYSAIFLLCNIAIVVFIGYIFGKWVTKPVVSITGGIKDLTQGNYNIYYESSGMYGEIRENLNNLAERLKSNELQRKETEKMREEWITNISHDIKTPLSSIKGYSEVLSSKDYEISQNEVNKYADIIQNKSAYIQSLIDDLSLTYKLKNNILPLSKKNENIIDVLRDTVIDILNHPKYITRRIDFDCDFDSLMMPIDEKLFKRAITNLLYNAIVHNDNSTKIWLKITKNKESSNIEIGDDGKGIAEENLEHIFERYYRGTGTGEAYKGSGLGLAIAKSIIEAHGGEISAESSIGKGTKIIIKFYNMEEGKL